MWAFKELQDATYGVVSHYYKKKVKVNHEVRLISVVHTFEADLNKMDMIFEVIDSLDGNIMPQLTCPSCGVKFECKKLTTVRCQLRWSIYRPFFSV